MSTVAEQLVHVLLQAGVTRVYGVVRDSLNPSVDAIRRIEGLAWIAAPVRARVCAQAGWLGIRLDPAANLRGGPRISTADSPVSAWVIRTNEELMIARHTVACARRP